MHTETQLGKTKIVFHKLEVEKCDWQSERNADNKTKIGRRKKTCFGFGNDATTDSLIKNSSLSGSSLIPPPCEQSICIPNPSNTFQTRAAPICNGGREFKEKEKGKKKTLLCSHFQRWYILGFASASDIISDFFFFFFLNPCRCLTVTQKKSFRRSAEWRSAREYYPKSLQ